MAVVQDEEKEDYVVEVMQRRFTVAAYPRVKYFSIAGKPEVVYVSRAATVREFRA